MSRNRHAARIDSNQREIVEQLRKIPGVKVELNHDDILVGYKGRTYWYEVKDPSTVSSKTGDVRQSEKKPSQIKLENEWTGHYRIIWKLEQILNEIKGC